ncbi:ShlB/FhaC/HecB family hemolysin secretion/activation protein [Pseudomonas sp. X10]
MPRSSLHRASLRFAVLWLSLLIAPLATANDPASQQLRDQQQQIQQLERQQRLQQWQRRAQPRESIDADAPPQQDQRCWPVSAVRLAGNRRLPGQKLEEALRPLIRPCMGVNDINQLLKAITERYVQAGYPTSRPFLAHSPQPGAPLDIQIVEGFVESVELADPELPLSLRGAFPELLGRPLYLPDLEQGLDQLNRLRAFDLGADLLPGQFEGGTRVVIQPRRVDPRWHLDSSYDNRGSPLTGRHRLGLGLGLDSPLGLNDYLRLSLTSTIAQAPGEARGLSIYYNIPYGPWTFGLNASRLSYRAPLPGGHLAGNGESTFHGLSLERTLWRNQQGLLSATARLDRKQLVNRQAGQVTRLQSPTLTTLEMGLNLLWLENGLWNAYLGLSQGVNGLGADRNALSQSSPQPHFRKYRANLLHLRQGPVNRPWRWQSELNLQYSSDPLPSIEQLWLSDDTAVRGFRQHSVAGATGAVWRNTLSYPLPLPLPATVELRPHLGLDLGWARYTQASPGQRLAGAAAGLSLSFPGSRLRFDYQRALHASDKPHQDLETGFWVLEWALNI